MTSPLPLAQTLPARPAGRRPERTWQRSVSLILIALACLTLTLLTAPTAGASDTPPPTGDGLSWSVRPADNDHGTDRPNFGYEIPPGHQVTDAIVVTNLSTIELTLQVYTADGYTTPSGSLDLLTADEPSVALGSWVSVETRDLTLAPGERAEVPFTITVPTDAAVGDHPGGIVAAHSATSEHGSVRQDSRLGSRIHVRVPGEYQVSLEVSEVALTYDAGWNPFASAGMHLTYRITNTGNVRTFAHESVDLAGPAGLGASNLRSTTPEVLPGDSIERSIDLGRTGPLVRLSADVALTPEAVGGLPGEQVNASTAVWSIPWGALVLAGVLITISAGIVLRRRTRRKRRVDLSAPGTPAGQPGGGGPG